MRTPIPFRLNRGGFILALVSAGFAGPAGAVAGRVEFVTGGAVAQGADGRERPLSKGQDLDKGDTVKTNNGRAQIRFTDGAYVSLQPNTEFSIKDYNYEGKTDGSERGLFALAKGAMRTITGFIGRVNRNRYAITTPTATVGIRGTGGVIQVLNDGSTLIVGTSGIWTLTNPAGTLDIPAGFSGKAPTTPSQPPQQTSEPPKADPAPPPPATPVFVEGNERTSTGDPASLCGSGAPVSGTCPSTTGPNPNPPLVSGSGYHVSYSWAGRNGAGAQVGGASSSLSLANAVFDSAGMLTGFSATNSVSIVGTHQEFGTAAGVVAWGRWIGDVSGTGPTTFSLSGATANQGFHYVVGIPPASLPASGSATYAFLGATKPTGSDGSLLPGTFSGTLSVTFGASTTISLAAQLAFSGFTYNLSGFGNSSGGSPAFTGSMTGNATGTPATGYACSASTCVASVNGAFFGAGAEYSGYAYNVGNTTGGNTVSGVAVFKK